LTALPAGTSCVVVAVEEGDEALSIRLKTMGLHEGRGLRVLREGKRLIVACGATRIGLSAAVASQVLVRRISSP
jgi:Fe2+ transport system protein FeoA